MHRWKDARKVIKIIKWLFKVINKERSFLMVFDIPYGVSDEDTNLILESGKTFLPREEIPKEKRKVIRILMPVP